ncbi:MAG: hypothetical protein LC720_08620 [Actinobacteria bacterium]|nr:hypothetical protein [Actinomycetota bacterium]
MPVSRPLRSLVLAGLLLLAALALGAPARAASIAPPGNSAVNQYFETVPTASGNQPPSVSTGLGSHGPAVSPATQRALAAQGADGLAAAAVATAGAPPVRTPATSSPRSSTAGGSPVGVGPTAVAAPPPVSSSAAGSGGISPVLPIVLVALLVGALAIGLARRRRRGAPPPPPTA